ncbi:MAG: DDE-type integrase/transposase/recombinase [Nitrospirota bacterium]
MLESHGQVKSMGGTTTGFCRVTGMGRAIIYRWQERRKTRRLEDAKPVAKTNPNRLPDAKKEEIKDMIRNYEIPTNAVIAAKAGVSAGTVSNIKKEMTGKRVVAMPVIQKNYEWNLRNVCWSMDTFQMKFGGRWIYVLLLMEEMSRMLLGYRISFGKSGWYSRELLLNAIAGMGIAPLVIKHDRGVEFMNKIFLSTVTMHGITTLASPGYYPMFNGRSERTVRLVKRIIKNLMPKWNCEIMNLPAFMSRAQYLINYDLPRKIFNGKTSAETYSGGMDYDECRRNEIIARFSYNQHAIYQQYFSGGKIFLDKHRKEVVEYLCQANLCQMRYRIKSNIG